jgi:large-conductance mechanosensitive channel
MIIVIATIIFLMYVIVKEHNERENKIKDIENRLEQYYIQREQRLIKSIKSRLRNNKVHP